MKIRFFTKSLSFEGGFNLGGSAKLQKWICLREGKSNGIKNRGF